MFKSLKKQAVALFCTAVFSSTTTIAAESVVVGGKFFTEQFILSEMTAQILKSVSIPVELKTGMGSSLVRKAQLNGEIDIYWEYTGTSLVVYNKVKEKLNSAETYQRVKAMDAKQGLVWLAPSNANNTFALAVRKQDVAIHGLSSLSDLAKAYRDGTELNMAATAEFIGRSDGIRSLQKAYDFRVPRAEIKSMDSGLAYTALKDNLVDIALVFATDGRISAFGFQLLKDDLSFFPDYAVVPVVRQEILKQYPQIESKLNKLSSMLDDKTMQRLNASVDIDKESVADVARTFLQSNDLL